MLNFIKYEMFGLFFKDNPTTNDSLIFSVEFIIVLVFIITIMNYKLTKSDKEFKNYYGVFK